MGPTLWTVTIISRTIQVADTKFIKKRGAVFGHFALLDPDAEGYHQCYYTAITPNTNLYHVKVKDLIDAAHDTELAAMLNK